SAVAAGVRRIEALTGDAARQYVNEQEARLRQAAQLLKVTPAEVNDRIAALIEERRALERELSETRRKLAMGGGGGSGPAVRQINGINFIGQVLEGVPAKDLRGLADEAKKRLGSGVAAFVAVNDGKAALLVGVTDDLTARHSAVDLVRAGAEAV